jgi:hypothetical protein
VGVIPLPQVVVDALAAHLAAFPAGPDGLVFTTEAGGPLRRSGFGNAWRKATVDAGVPGFVFHGLRHYYASLLIRHGESVKTVQERLGHASAVETLDTYSHLWPDSDDRTREAVDCVLAPAPAADSLRTAGWPDLAFSQFSGSCADELACTPGSVPARGHPRAGGDHPSTTYVAARLQRSTRELGRAALKHSLSDLAPGGVCRAAPVTRCAGGLLHHRFTLTAPGPRAAHGGLFSVALSRGSPRVGVTHHLALRSPDVPRWTRRSHAAARPAHPHIQPSR